MLPAAGGLAFAAPASAAPGFELDEPIVVQDGRKPIDVDVGHVAPFVADWDGDGRQDLLVGQFGEGKVRLYLNKGTVGEPRFDGFTYLKAGGADARVPAG